MRNPHTNSEPAVASHPADTSDTASSQPRVLLFGIDGLRWDIAAEPGVAPHLQRMADQGQWREMEMEVPTISAPGWASILSGTTHAEHGFRDNSCVGGRNWQHPDVLAQAFYRDQSTRTFAAAGWPVLVDPAGLGPIIHPRIEQQYAGLHRLVIRNGEVYGYQLVDAEVVDFTLAAVREGGFDMGFCYCCDVDDAGHVYGLKGREYRDAIARVDAHLGRIMQAVTQRYEQYAERWLIVGVSDHGHLDEGGHGGDSPQERASWLSCWSPDGQTPSWPAHVAPHEVASLLLQARFGDHSPTTEQP
ncbi:alkaline phosphatase family protein [Corynebacterium pseudopelargi]|uniref:Type I phosphodiesterase / nucleotide pyrophosphatase n=1 Tax=Corynebacterium pseudopelargi TaxID=2080757 RepID=A0A3G6IWM3_9CORY|nr:alkaline phosphatase family protein [Corynebacterium pseudopelargi]AZA09048.1 Type I phosphodiesterase / nucleotide pyrophosphatase [Corynebacterium pseudopelargi]